MNSEERERKETDSHTIKWVEKRILELEAAVRKESNIRNKTSMQQSIRVNKLILKQLLDAYWRENEKAP